MTSHKVRGQVLPFLKDKRLTVFMFRATIDRCVVLMFFCEPQGEEEKSRYKLTGLV